MQTLSFDDWKQLLIADARRQGERDAIYYIPQSLLETWYNEGRQPTIIIYRSLHYAA